MARKPKGDKAARQPRTAKETEPATEQAKSSEVRRVISQQRLRSLMKSKRAAQADMDEIAGGLGSEVKTAVEKHYLNRKVFGWVCQLDRMENEKIAMHLDDLDHYLDISGLRDRAAKVERMEFGPGEEDGEGEGDNNVHDFPAPRGVAAE